MTDNNVILEVKDLKLYFPIYRGLIQRLVGYVKAVDGVSFDLCDGEVLGLVGESGCGKSSLARAILRLLPRNVEAYDGCVRVNGLDVMPLDEEQFRRDVRWSKISIVMQAAMNALNPVLRVADQVIEPLLVHQGRQRDVVKILRPGDVVTHLFTGYPGGLLDDNGRLQPEVKEAYVNGLRFDVGHGLYNMSFDTAARVLDQGIEPHSISTDGHKVARQRLVYDLPTTMAKMLNLGFTLPQLVNKATYEAATSLGKPELVPGIAPGRRDDIQR